MHTPVSAGLLTALATVCQLAATELQAAQQQKCQPPQATQHQQPQPCQQQPQQQPHKEQEECSQQKKEQHQEECCQQGDQPQPQHLGQQQQQQREDDEQQRVAHSLSHPACCAMTLLDLFCALATLPWPGRLLVGRSLATVVLPAAELAATMLPLGPKPRTRTAGSRCCSSGSKHSTSNSSSSGFRGNAVVSL